MTAPASASLVARRDRCASRATIALLDGVRDVGGSDRFDGRQTGRPRGRRGTPRRGAGCRRSGRGSRRRHRGPRARPRRRSGRPSSRSRRATAARGGSPRRGAGSRSRARHSRIGTRGKSSSLRYVPMTRSGRSGEASGERREDLQRQVVRPVQVLEDDQDGAVWTRPRRGARPRRGRAAVDAGGRRPHRRPRRRGELTVDRPAPRTSPCAPSPGPGRRRSRRPPAGRSGRSPLGSSRIPVATARRSIASTRRVLPIPASPATNRRCP